MTKNIKCVQIYTYANLLWLVNVVNIKKKLYTQKLHIFRVLNHR